MVGPDSAASVWHCSSGETISLEAADTPAPFKGYIAFFNGSDRAGYNLLFGRRPTRATYAVVHAEDDLTRVWLKFQDISRLTRLDYQPIEVYSSLIDSGLCTIVARSDGDDDIYRIPVRIEMLKAQEIISASEVSDGTWSSNALCANGNGRGSACQFKDEGAPPLL